jgi:quinol monooxygenase YgiN
LGRSPNGNSPFWGLFLSLFYPIAFYLVEVFPVKKDIYWLCTFRVKPSDLAAFKAVVRPLVEETRKETGSMAYEYNVTADNSVIHILEHYRDSAAVVHHVTKTFSQFATDFTKYASVESFTVYGSPEPEAKTILDSFGAVYVTPFDGFTK